MLNNQVNGENNVVGDDVQLVSISVKNIMRFGAASQTIEFKHLNKNKKKCKLAVIIGANGTGKSNIARIFDNVFNNQPLEGDCQFEFHSKGGTFIVTNANNKIQLNGVDITDKEQLSSLKTNIAYFNPHFKRRNIKEEKQSTGNSGQVKLKKIDIILKNLQTNQPNTFACITKKLKEWSGWNLCFESTNQENAKRFINAVEGATNTLHQVKVYKQNIFSKQFHLNQVESAVEELLWFFVSIYSTDCNTIFLDEPDKTFHPQFVRKMLSEIGKLGPDKTVLLISHSAEIIDWCHSENLIKTVIDENGATKYLKAPNVTSIPFAGELFFTDKVILVEGITDWMVLKYLREYIEEHDIQGFDTFLSSTILHMDGKNKLKIYINLCERLEVKYKVILDRDALFSSANEVDNNKFDDLSINDILILCKGDTTKTVGNAKTAFTQTTLFSSDEDIILEKGKYNLKSFINMLKTEKSKKRNETKYSNVKQSLVGGFLAQIKLGEVNLTQTEYGKTEMGRADYKTFKEISNECIKNNIFVWTDLHDIEDLIFMLNIVDKITKQGDNEIKEKYKVGELKKKNFKNLCWKAMNYEKYLELIDVIFKVDNKQITEEEATLYNERIQFELKSESSSKKEEKSNVVENENVNVANEVFNISTPPTVYQIITNWLNFLRCDFQNL